MTKSKNMTPMMTQYWDIKSAHPDKIVLYRMGDFFEMFFEDAIQAAPLLGIALTQRNKKSEEQTPMCGVPYHSVAGPINKLLSHGLKVAICDQIEDPKSAKGIVKRAVTRVLTPGMVFDVESLESTLPHYLFAFDKNSEGWVASFLDATTGESFYFNLRVEEEIRQMLQVLSVAEVVCTSDQRRVVEDWGLLAVVSSHDEVFEKNEMPISAQRLLSYVRSVNPQASWEHLQTFEKRNFLSRLEVSPLTLNHLEVFQTYQGQVQGSLYAAINRTLSAAGGRLLRSWLAFPLKNHSLILERQSEIQRWLENPRVLISVRENLRGLGDLQRRFAKIGQSPTSPRDVLALVQTLQQGTHILRTAHQALSEESQQCLEHLATETLEALRDDLPISSKQGLIFKPGYHAQLDEYLSLSQNSADLILALEAKEREKNQIPSLKIRYNQVFGYYIEVTHVHKDKIPAYYSRKQTLVNAERYLTPELEELEKKILSSQALRNDLESELFEGLRRRLLDRGLLILQVANRLAQLDVLTSLAWLAQEQKYVAPVFNQEGVIHLELSRHPVVESQNSKTFVANTLSLKRGEAWILTGPNMAGKSTLMRQMAICALMAQMGSFVPARQARLPLFDKLFTRIGASDQLSLGLSTFMVEMQESADILKNATRDSLVILDEIGRGTATYDGMSLAQAIFEFLVREKQSTLFFATHYHELTHLVEKFVHVKNKHMAISDHKGRIDFLYTLKEGAAGRSYGVHVAELAGLPKPVTERASEILHQLESKSFKPLQLSLLDFVSNTEELTAKKSSSLAGDEQRQENPLERDILDSIGSVSLNDLTPLEALNRIAEWQKQLAPSPVLNLASKKSLREQQV